MMETDTDQMRIARRKTLNPIAVLDRSFTARLSGAAGG
jgi:hypothetical protein